MREAVQDGEKKEVGDYSYAMNGGSGSRRSEKPKEIIKEGLSEYFIYTIEAVSYTHLTLPTILRV